MYALWERDKQRIKYPTVGKTNDQPYLQNPIFVKILTLFNLSCVKYFKPIKPSGFLHSIKKNDVFVENTQNWYLLFISQSVQCKEGKEHLYFSLSYQNQQFFFTQFKPYPHHFSRSLLIFTCQTLSNFVGTRSCVKLKEK